jgi:SAM-dependent methyltransferase
MTSNSLRWETRYAQAPAPAEPHPLLTSFAGLLPPRGLALDVACGAGGDSVYLAERGLRVIAVDRSWEALRRDRELAAARPCTLGAG